MTAARQPQLEDVARSAIMDDAGRSYADFRSTLKPRWPVVARDFLFGYAMLAVSAGLVVIGSDVVEAWRVLWVLAGAVMIGFWMAYIQLYLHEAAHFNLWPDRRVNDRLANLLVGVWVATEIREYRQIHWDHHRFLGLPEDTERSYFSALNARFLLESLFLVAAIRVILHRRGKVAQKSRTPAAGMPPGIWMPAAAAAAHTAVLALCVWQRQFELAAAWLIGNLMFYPLFGALRQLLEHRDEDASPAIDYATVPHGKTTRSFKAGPIGTFFGGAGFRLHDIHHFDPELSYTNLPAADAFLRRCHNAKRARSESRTYGRVAVALWR